MNDDLYNELEQRLQKLESKAFYWDIATFAIGGFLGAVIGYRLINFF